MTGEPPLTVLDDGEYDVLVIDATPDVGDESAVAGEGPRWVVELTILTGGHKGEVVAVRAAGLGDDEIALLGMPGTLTVAGGAPTLHIGD